MGVGVLERGGPVEMARGWGSLTATESVCGVFLAGCFPNETPHGQVLLS